MNVITLGVHVVDVLVRPVEEIPEGQGGQLVEQIRITPAGPAGGTAVTLAKLGASVRSAGAIGDDELGDVMLELLGRFGVDASLLVRREGVQTSASVLPIRPDGSRPAFHVIGANATYSAADAPREEISRCRLPAPRRARVHGRRGGGEDPVVRPRARGRDLGGHPRARRAGRGDPRLDRAGVRHLDYLLPNDEQVLALSGETDLIAGCRALLDRGVGCVAATCGADGAVVVDERGSASACRRSRSTSSTPPAAATRSRRASSGVSRSGGRGATRPRWDARWRRSSPQGLGSDHGDFDLAAADAFINHSNKAVSG